MKKHNLLITLLAGLGLALFSPTALAQGNAGLPTLSGGSTTPPTSASTNGWTLAGLFSGGAWDGVKHGAQDLISYVENTSITNGIITVEAGALYAQSTHQTGGFLDVYLPVGGTNSAFGAGFGIAYLDHNFYDATLNARLGDTIKLPLIKLPLYAYLESGGGWNLSKNEAMAQAFTGALLSIPITHEQSLTLGFAVGTISDYPGLVDAIGGSYTWRW